MATLDIGGRKVTVDDGFLKLPPEQQNATVEEIAASLGPADSAPAKKEFGLGDTWPAQIAKSIYSGLTLPGDTLAGKAKIPSSGAVPGSVPFGDQESAGLRVADLAGIASPMAPKVAASLAPARSAVPTQAELLAAGKSGYNQARELGVEIAGSSIKSMADNLAVTLEKDGVNGELAPKTFSIISRLQNPPAGAKADIGNFETIRRTLSNAGKDFTNPTEKLAASRAIDHLDDYLTNIPAGDVLAGDAAAASKVLGQARGNYAAAKRSQTVTDALETADLNAAVANSGANVGNATRQRLNSILKSDRASRGFSDDELAQMEQVARGTFTGNTARKVGNLLGGGGGLGAVASAAAGAAATGGWGAIAPIVGMGIKQIENMSVARQAKILDELVRSRSPLAEAAPAATREIGTPAQAAVVRALIEGKPLPSMSDMTPSQKKVLDAILAQTPNSL